ncbi:hypothetical protein AB0G05_17395 [Nonomuraea wenchangensis]
MTAPLSRSLGRATPSRDQALSGVRDRDLASPRLASPRLWWSDYDTAHAIGLAVAGADPETVVIPGPVHQQFAPVVDAFLREVIIIAECAEIVLRDVRSEWVDGRE